MNDKNDKDIDRIKRKFNEEFRKVRFYSNINGVEKEYGYDYDRDSEGKENYKEIGEIPEEFGSDYIERILNLKKSFDWDDDLFARSFDRLTSIFPSFEKIFSGRMTPQLTPGVERESMVPEQKNKNPYQVAYDMQVDKEKNQLYLIVELPGFSKDQINLKLAKNRLRLFGENDRKKVDTEIPLENEIDKNQKINATMKNGILEVKMKLVEGSNGDEEDIVIS